MANIKSQKKRVLTNEKARLRNRSLRAALKTAAKKVHAAVDAGDKEAAIAAAQAASRELDRAVTKGVIHKNQAANRKSGLMKLANSADAEAAEAVPAPKKAPAKKPAATKAPAAKKAPAKKEETTEEAEAEEPKPKKAPAKKAPAKKAAPKKAEAEKAE